MELFYIRKVLDGDSSQFSYFVTAYKHMAFSIAYRITRNKEDAEEVVQDSFLKAYRSLNKFRQDSKFSTWFYRIVVNASLSRIKSKGFVAKTKVVDLEDISEGQIETIETTYSALALADQKRLINQALDAMTREDSVLLTLYYLEENSMNEVAEITGALSENVKMKLYRARKKMYAIISKILKSEIHSIV